MTKAQYPVCYFPTVLYAINKKINVIIIIYDLLRFVTIYYDLLQFINLIIC